jgi:hypothetical protein
MRVYLIMCTFIINHFLCYFLAKYSRITIVLFLTLVKRKLYEKMKQNM